MFTQDSGSEIFIRESHPAKALAPIFVTLSGITTFVRALQFWQAPSAISVTPAGKTIPSRVWHSRKAFQPTSVSGRLKVIIPHPSSYEFETITALKYRAEGLIIALSVDVYQI
jgi:hypothetical protein